MEVIKHILVIDFLMLVLFSQAFAQLPVLTPWRITFQIAKESDTPVERIFGVDSSGTEGFDNGIDQIAAPPPPSRWYAYFSTSVFPNSLVSDIRSNAQVTRSRTLGNTWLLNIIASNSETITIRWNTSSFPQGNVDAGVLRLRDSMDVLIVDMLHDTVVSISGNKQLYIEYQAPKSGTSAVEENRSNEIKFCLLDNFPNPFNPSTTIRYGLPLRSRVQLQIYDILGHVVKELINSEQNAGYQSVIWDANIASGLYFYRIVAISIDNPDRRFVETKKMILLR